jgi:hypothetical protein
MIDFFIHHEYKSKKIPKDTAQVRFYRWLKPKYETEHDRKVLMDSYMKKKAQNQAFKNLRHEVSEKDEKLQNEPIESILKRV